MMIKKKKIHVVLNFGRIVEEISWAACKNPLGWER